MTARQRRPSGRSAEGAAAGPPEAGEGEELAVLEGGRWAGRWYWRRDLEASQRAAERMGHPVTVAGPGELRGYAPTDRWRDHPGDHDPGRVWTWALADRG